MLTAREALERLREGNRRFASNVLGVDAFLSHARRAELATKQEPFAIVLVAHNARRAHAQSRESAMFFDTLHFF